MPEHQESTESRDFEAIFLAEREHLQKLPHGRTNAVENAQQEGVSKLQAELQDQAVRNLLLQLPSSDREVAESTENDSTDFGSLGKLKSKGSSRKSRCANEISAKLGTDAASVDELRPEISVGNIEPFASYVPEDLVALCSSGGGIRSSTFNLGVLQGLHKLGLLPLFDYHSTVSGGGYVGGWWTSWRERGGIDLFPSPEEGETEPAEIRRLREHSHFLSPTGLAWNGELWRGGARLVYGAVSTLMLAFSVLALAVSAWILAKVCILGCLPESYHFVEYAVLPILAAAMALVSELPPIRKRPGAARSFRVLALFCFFAGIGYAALDFIWWAAESTFAGRPIGISAAVGTSSGAAGLVYWLSKWVVKRGDSKKPTAIASLVAKHLPQLLSLVAIILLTLLLVSAAQALGGTLSYKTCIAFLGAAAGLALVATLTIAAPSTLHQFYCERISESFLHPTSEHINDAEGKDRAYPANRPLHIVNCCASDLDYSVMRRKDRRGASVALSKLGYHIENHSHSVPYGGLTLAESLTASASAVDPAMGYYSATLGKLVSFVLFAFNLRLGTWLAPREYPGFAKFLRPWKEAFSRLTLGTIIDDGNRDCPDLHLTDGGHFENLAAYEMIRRRCRYIIVCDAGADPTHTFSDFSILQQLVREDFGVEIDIDLDALRPGASGLSKQHMVAGSIKYSTQNQLDGGIGCDGILIYIKPSLTGDEPEDITQYRVRDATFPHQSTGDQFFDSFQWEAYRRLGEHAVETGLRFVSKYASDINQTLAPRIFDAAYREWKSEKTVAAGATQRLAGRDAIASTLTPEARKVALKSLFPEFASALGGDSGKSDAAAESLCTALVLLDEMEAAYNARRLAEKGDCLENWGWENWADRLSAMPELIDWWPVVAPLYEIRFRNLYLGKRYALNETLPFVTLRGHDFPFVKAADFISQHGKEETSFGRVAKRLNEAREEIGSNDWLIVATQQVDIADAEPCEMALGGLLFRVQESNTDTTLTIHIDDLQVAPGYWSVGINSLLVGALLRSCSKTPSSRTEQDEASTSNHPWKMPVKRIEVLPRPSKESRKVLRPNQRAFWATRGFVQKRSGKLVRFFRT